MQLTDFNVITTTTAKKMKSILVLLLIIMLIVLVESGKSTKNFEMASNQFALELWQKLSAENQAKTEPENLFFSPYSIATALSMVYVGANGNTRTELGSALKLNNTPLEDPQELATEIQKSSELMFGQSGDKSYNLSSANALAISDNFEILDSYKKLIVDKFSAEMFSVDFAKDSSGATEKINQWVSNKTHDKIDNFLEEPLPSNTVMALLNAIYFKGSWKSPFNPNNTFNGSFVGLNGKEYRNVSYMSEKSRFNISVKHQDAKFTMVELPYESGVISLYAFLPSNNGSNEFVQMKNQLNTTTIEQTIKQKYSRKITLQFPKLNLENKIDLNQTLKSMGVNDLFGGQANLDGISNQSNIKVSDVRHQAMLELNEKGSEAAAVTGVTIEATSIQQEIIINFNRPFVFVIRHNQSEQLLFVGEVNRF